MLFQFYSALFSFAKVRYVQSLQKKVFVLTDDRPWDGLQEDLAEFVKHYMETYNQVNIKSVLTDMLQLYTVRVWDIFSLFIVIEVACYYDEMYYTNISQL